MIRAVALYEEAPDPERYARHIEVCKRVPGATFRHGEVFGAPTGEPRYRYYAEFEFTNREAFKAAAGSPEFAATAKDAQEMGKKLEVMFADLR